MTSPTEPSKPPLTERISQRISFGRRDPTMDPEERFTRNVTIGFAALIVIAALIIIIGLGYGYYDANLRPIANVAGVEVSRGMLSDRIELERLRLERAQRQVRDALVSGQLDADLGDRRLASISADLQDVQNGAIDRLVDLLYQEQLAEQEGVTLDADELETALAEDGSSPEIRRVGAIVVQSAEEENGLAPTAEGRQEAQERAAAALAALDDGASFADVAEEYSPATAGTGGDIGYVERSDISDPVWADAVFALDEDGHTDIIEGEQGELLIGHVFEIVPPQPDPGFGEAARERVGEEAYRRNVELEALAAKLEDKIVADEVTREYDQVKLAEILVRGDPFVDPAEDEGSIRASHILYAPGDVNAAPVPEDDPAWDEAEAEAQRAADQLRAVADADYRAKAFAARALRDSDGPSSVNGGDLGYFSRQSMIAEFADAVFEPTDLQFGDIVGPVRTDYGWHVIMFNDRLPPLADRLAAVEEALSAEDADFGTVAMELSEGLDAPSGGEMGWQVVDELDELTALALSAIEIGEVTEPVEGEEGYYIYQKEDEVTRALEPAAAARVASTAFLDWYDDKRFAAEDDGLISIDDSVFSEGLPALSQQLP